MRKKLFVLVVCIVQILSGCTQEAPAERTEIKEEIDQEELQLEVSAVKYNICNSEVEIAEIYFNDEEDMKCSENNNYREPILERIEMISEKEKYSGGFFDFEPEITLVSDTGVKYALSSAAPHASQDLTKNYYYIKVVGSGNPDLTYYYEADEDVALLRELMRSAIEYEHTKGSKKEATGVVVNIREDFRGKVCGIQSPESGYQIVIVDDFDGVIIGDTVEYNISGRIKDGKMQSEYVGTIQNVTRNDISKSSEEVVTTYPFEYHIMNFELENDNFRKDGFDVICDREDFEFELQMIDEKLPLTEIKNLSRKYNMQFFEEHILLYCGLRVTDVEVTAAANINWAVDDNYVFVKEKTDEVVPEGECYLLWVEIEKEKWNDRWLDLYLY